MSPMDKAVSVFHPDHSPRAAHAVASGEATRLMQSTLPVLDTD